MTSRECLIETLNHREPDRVVVDMGSTSVTGINANALNRLRDALGMEKERIKICEPLQLLGEVENDLRQKLQLDCVELSANTNIFGFSNSGRKPWVLPTGLEVDVPLEFNTTVDEQGRTYIYPQGDMSVPPSGVMPYKGHFFDNITRGNIEFDEDTTGGREDFKNDYNVLSDEQLRYMEDTCNYYYNNTDLGIVANMGLASLGDFAIVPGPSVKHPKGIRNLPDFMMAQKICPDYIHEVFEYHTEIALKNAALIKEACGNKLQVIYVSGTDFGTQNGPFMSLENYREFYKPYYQKINGWIHENTEWKTFFHTCGSIMSFLQDFYESGIDILNPVQLSAKGMDGKVLKEQWGDKFVFWGGGVDTQKTLPFGTPEEVYNEVLDRLKLFAPGGGFVFNTTHNIQSQTPAENVIAMFKAIEDYDRMKGQK